MRLRYVAAFHVFLFGLSFAEISRAVETSLSGCDVRSLSLDAFESKPGETLVLRGHWGESQEAVVIRLTHRNKSTNLKIVSWTSKAVIVQIPFDALPRVYDLEVVCADDPTTVRRGNSLPFRVTSTGRKADLLAFFDDGFTRFIFAVIGVLVLLAIYGVLYPRFFPKQAASDMEKSGLWLRSFLTRAATLKSKLQPARSEIDMRKYNRDYRRSYLLLGWFIICGAIGMMSYASVAILIGHVSKSWPWTEDSNVVWSHISRGMSGRNPYYVPRVEYEYRVSGRQYVGDRVFFGFPNAGYQTSYEIKSKYRSGGVARVYYFKRHPAIAVLMPGIHRQNFVGIVIGLAFSFVGFLCLKKASEYEE